MQRNFFLTDLMKTGTHQTYERFLDSHSLPDQKIDYTGEYYTLHNWDLDSYDRKFAIIDRSTGRIGQKLLNLRGNEEFTTDLEKRINLLHSQGFKFIMATPWESLDNINNSSLYPQLDKFKEVDWCYWTAGVSWFWFYMYDKHLNNKFKFTHDHSGSYWHKKHDFLYLNKQPRKHRVKLYNKLLKENVLSNSVYTFLGLNPPVRLKKEFELPWVDANNYPDSGMDQDITEQPYIDTVCSIVSETNDNADNNDIFITEKIWKPIMAQHVFVVHGNHLYLQKLREMGFKTFGSYFDESYDLENDTNKKIDKIVSLCKELKTKDWHDLYLQTLSLRQHNYDTFFNYEKMSEQVNKTIIGFFDYFDSKTV